MIHAWIAGATGLTGSFLIHELLNDPRVDRVSSFVRKVSTVSHPKLNEVLYTTEGKIPQLDGAPEVVFCCLGTTIGKAGSKEAFRAVDVELVEQFIDLAKQKGARSFVLQSSVGADARSSNFYLHCKGEAEEALISSGLPQVVVVRPSFLEGPRKEFRLGEKIGLLLMRVFNPLMIGKLRRYRSVHVKTVARVMKTKGLDQCPGVWIIESESLV